MDVVEVVVTADEASSAPPPPSAGPGRRPRGLRGFHPGWFGAVMGTAVVGIIAITNPGSDPAFATSARVAAQTMTIAALALGVLLLVTYLARVVRYPRESAQDLADPTTGALYGTLPGGILVIAAALAAVGPTWWPPSTVQTLVAVLDWIGVPLAFAVSVLFAYELFVRAELVPESVNGGWFIPPVVNIVVPLVIAPLIPFASPTAANSMLVVSYSFFGMGVLLYLVILTMLFHRLALHALPHAALAPSLWIGLGPIGVGSLALIKLAAVGAALEGPAGPSVALGSKIVATILWGFGAWWFTIAAVLLLRYLRVGSLPYGIGWWGFTFPLGAYTVATVAVAQAWSLRWLSWTGAGLLVLLALFWLTVVARTIRALSAGEI